ncbi:MAG TPA: acyl-CoA dehydrogenase, partial [Solirubrobacteraceae bacterium]|nr:acyl-CoA dehydrogenase [Solirubrobacteraceae bacterium]
ASHILIVCRSEAGSDKHTGLSMILVPREAEGMTISPITTMGGTEVNELALEGCRVPGDAVVGEPGDGWRQLMAGLNVERVILAASALGLAQRAFDDALAYVKEREQFGRPVGTFQSLQHRFADLATALLQARLLLRHAAAQVDDDPGAMTLAQEASMAKLACTELAKRCALEGMQAMGGYGYAVEYPMEGYLRSALVTTIFGGTSEIQRNIIARTLGL